MRRNFYRDFEEYGESIRDADIRVALPRLIEPRWDLSYASAGAIHVQIGSEGSGNIAEGSGRSDGFVAYLSNDRGTTLANGQAIDDSSDLFLIGPDAEFTISTTTPHDWMSIYVPSNLLGADEVSRDFALRTPRCELVRIGRRAATRLRAGIASYVESARREPSLLHDPATTRLAEKELLERFLQALRRSPTTAKDKRRAPRREVVRLALAFVESSGIAGASVTDLARHAQVSERTLRNAFVETFQLSPQKYIRLQRFAHARKALSNADPESTTVTEVAVSCGFWQFGRFAVEYRRRFGESPSETLRRGAGSTCA